MKKSRKNMFWGYLTSIDLYNCNPKTIRDSSKIKKFVKKLVELIDMQTYGETQIVHFGKDKKVAGFSMIQFIETSLISGHFANESNSAYIDIFSCKEYSHKKASEFAKKFFKAEKCTINTLKRK